MSSVRGIVRADGARDRLALGHAYNPNFTRSDGTQRPHDLRNEWPKAKQSTGVRPDHHDCKTKLTQVLLAGNASVHGGHGAKARGSGFAKESAVLQASPTHLADSVSVVARQLLRELPGQVLI
jgi:hypothetical protein